MNEDDMKLMMENFVQDFMKNNTNVYDKTGINEFINTNFDQV